MLDSCDDCGLPFRSYNGQTTCDPCMHGPNLTDTLGAGWDDSANQPVNGLGTYLDSDSAW